MIKKIILSFLVFLVLTFSFVPLAHAQTGQWYNQSFEEWFTKVDASPENEIFGERYTAAQVQWVIYGLFYFILNGGTGGNNDVLNCLMTSDLSQCVDEINKLLPTAQVQPQKSLLASMFEDRSLSAVTYFKNVGRNLHLVPPASAQTTPGFGFSALDPVLPLWRAVRNISYVLFVFVILALAFMIMFRVKISPQVVISVQSALPKIALSLVLITFSYAIAGFLVDLMYVVIGLVSLFLASSGISFSSNPVTQFNFLTQGAVLGVPIGIPGLLILYLMSFTILLFFILMAGNGLGALLSNLFLPASGLVFGFISIIAFIVLIIVFLFAAFKIFWMLIKTFANILLLTIFAPLQLALGVVVQTVGFGSWLKSLVSNLAVFPATGLLFMLSFIFLAQAVRFTIWNILPSGPAWLDSLAGSLTSSGANPGWPPLLGVSDKMISLVFLGVSLAIMLIIPKVVDAIQGFIQGKPLSYGAAIGEALGPAKTFGGMGATAGVGTATEVVARRYPRGSWQVDALSSINQAIQRALGKH